MLVYMLRNTVNGKMYVGQTRYISIAKRWRGKFADRTTNLHFSAAIRQCGVKAFKREILAICATQEEADNMEKLWIAVLHTTDRRFGYNLMSGGKHGSPCHNKATRRQISKSMKKMWAQRSNKERERIKRKIRKAWARTRAAHIEAIRRGLRNARQKHI